MQKIMVGFRGGGWDFLAAEAQRAQREEGGKLQDDSLHVILSGAIAPSCHPECSASGTKDPGLSLGKGGFHFVEHDRDSSLHFVTHPSGSKLQNDMGCHPGRTIAPSCHPERSDSGVLAKPCR